MIEAHRNRQGGNIVRLLVWTGCRVSEAVGAKWSEFDLERGLWERSARRNKQGQATITPLAPMAVNMLKRMRATSVAVYLFPSPRNRGLPLQDIKSYWLHVRKLAGLPALRVHDLRHVHAQALLDANVPFDTIASLLGHSSTSMTEKYAHRSSAALRDAADLAARMLAPTSITP